MRLLYTLLVLLPLIACGEPSVTIRGTLLPGSDATDVYVVGQPIRSVIEADSFVIAGVRGDTVDLEFAEDGDRLGRMRLERWDGSDLTLRGIWIDDGIAYATGLDAAGAATVNGLRMAADGELPRRVAVDGVVLAVSRGGDALILRPGDERMPDLRVVVTPGTALEYGDADGGGMDLEFGDSLRIEGTAESGYVVATRVSVRPRVAFEETGAAEEWVEIETEPALVVPAGREEEVEERREGPRSLQRPGGGKGRGRGLQPRRD